MYASTGPIGCINAGAENVDQLWQPYHMLFWGKRRLQTLPNQLLERAEAKEATHSDGHDPPPQ